MPAISSVPFYSNMPDNAHCLQASFRMILKYFLPERDFSWEELEKMSAMQPGLATWPQQMLLNLHRMNFDIVRVAGFDIPAFVEEGSAYLERAFGKEFSEWQIANSNIPLEQKICRNLLATDMRIEARQPDLKEFKTFLDAGYLINCRVNSQRLNNKDGYQGHAIVVYAMDDHIVTFHDPGLPAHEAREATHDEFVQAWAYPNDAARNLVAIRLKANKGRHERRGSDSSAPSSRYLATDRGSTRTL